jgi:hypothetical protein
MADRPLTNRNNAIVDKHYAFGKLNPETDPNPPILDAPKYPSSPDYSFENPPPRIFVGTENEPAAEPGFYVVPRSVPACAESGAGISGEIIGEAIYEVGPQ